MADNFETENMACSISGACLVFVHGTVSPTDVEWDRALQLLQQVGLSRARMLVYTDGAAPNAAQRARLLKVSGDEKPPISVLTNSPVARAAGTAISWFNPEIRAFPPSAIEAALDHIGLAGKEREAAKACLVEMRARRS